MGSYVASNHEETWFVNPIHGLIIAELSWKQIFAAHDARLWIQCRKIESCWELWEDKAKGCFPAIMGNFVPGDMNKQQYESMTVIKLNVSELHYLETQPQLTI